MSDKEELRRITREKIMSATCPDHNVCRGHPNLVEGMEMTFTKVCEVVDKVEDQSQHLASMASSLESIETRLSGQRSRSIELGAGKFKLSLNGYAASDVAKLLLGVAVIASIWFCFNTRAELLKQLKAVNTNTATASTIP